MATSRTSIRVGDLFTSYKELEAQISSYQKDNSVQLAKRDSRTLDSSRKRAPKRAEKANQSLVYYSIHYACVFGGKKYKNEGTGQRWRQQTIKQGCAAGIKLMLSDNAQSLIVTEVVEDHNHEVNKDIYDHLPNQRRLEISERSDVEELLKLKVNKKLLQQHISKTTGKAVTLKDISNVQTGIHAKSDKNDLNALVSKLEAIEGSIVEVFKEDEDMFTGIFYQDHQMKRNFDSYPEVLMIDATYKLNNLRMPLYLMMIVDANGQSEIVGSFLTVFETEEAITKMVQTFKTHNSNWTQTKVVMSDKDFTERMVFRKGFPNASLTICLFHTLRTMRREVTCDKLGILPGERDHALELLTKLAYSFSPEQYDDYYKDLKESGLKSVIVYYDVNWHSIRSEWVTCFKGVNFTAGEQTNNRLESINCKIKSVCSKYATLSTFFDQFLAVLSTLRNERDHNTLMALAKKPVTTFSPNSPEEKYSQILTPFAANYVYKQLDLRKKIKVGEDDGVICEILSSTGQKINVTNDSCQCSFWMSMHLPCRHMFAVRESRQVSLYCPSCIAQRWTKSYMHQTFKNKNEISCDSSVEVTVIESQKGKKSLSQHQKFNRAYKLGQELASLASEVGMAEFQRRFNAMKSLKESWLKGKEAVVIEADGDSSSEELSEQHVEKENNEDALILERIHNMSDQVHVQDVQTSDKRACNTIESCINSSINPETSDLAISGQDCNLHVDCNVTTSKEELSIRKLTLPPIMKKRGRPKGAEKTVIGLPSRKKFAGSQVRKPVPFLKKIPINKDEVILSWFVDRQVKDAALERKRVIEEDEIEMRPERIPASCLDENVFIPSVQKYFSADAWTALTHVLETVKSNAVWYCGACEKSINDENDDSIVCESCLKWFHFPCVSIKRNPKQTEWFCRNCH